MGRKSHIGSLTTSNAMALEVLSINVPADFWRCAVSSDGIIASCHTLYNKHGDLIHQQVISTSFTPVLTQQKTIASPSSVAATTHTRTIHYSYAII